MGQPKSSCLGSFQKNCGKTGVCREKSEGIPAGPNGMKFTTAIINMRVIAFLVTAFAFATSVQGDPRPLQNVQDVVIQDFKATTWDKVTGEAGDAPAHGTLPGQMPVDGFLGKGSPVHFIRVTGT